MFVPGEDYLESLSMLRGVLGSSKRFVVLELGCMYGFWALRAAVAWKRWSQLLSPSDRGSCDIVLVESDPAFSAQIPKHLALNGITAFCNVSIHTQPASVSLLDGLLKRFGIVDVVHVDIQNHEYKLLHG